MANRNLLLDLPAELRNRIFEEVVPLDLQYHNSSSQYPGHHQATPAIARVCQQIRAETLSLWRWSNEFSFFGAWNDNRKGADYINELSLSGLHYMQNLYIEERFRLPIGSPFVAPLTMEVTLYIVGSEYKIYLEYDQPIPVASRPMCDANGFAIVWTWVSLIERLGQRTLGEHPRSPNVQY